MQSNKERLRSFLSAAFILLTLLPIHSQGQTRESKDSNKGDSALLPLDPLVRTGKLPNGFTYFIRQNKEPRKRVFLYLVNKVGSILEDEDQQGLAHFIEHMSFNGTTHFPKNELINYLQKSGVRFGADLNAYTNFDETVYQLPLPTDSAKLLQNGFQIMRDWAQEATLDPEEIRKERGVVLEEKRLGKGAAQRMQQKYIPILLNGSRYARRLPIGTDTVLNSFKRETLSRYYHTWYRPDLQALIVVGDINIDQTEQTIKALFSDLKNPAHEQTRTAYTIPLNGQNHFIQVSDKEMTSTVAMVYIKHPEPPYKKRADVRTAVRSSLFNMMLSLRYQELGQMANPPFISGGAEISSFFNGLDAYSASVSAKPGELEKGFKAVWRESQRVRLFGFTATELNRAKQSFSSSLETGYAEKDKTNSSTYVSEYQQYFLKDIAAPGMDLEYKLFKSILPQITLAEVNGLTKEYIRDKNRDIIILGPEKDKSQLPNESQVNAWLHSVEQEKLQPYSDKTASTPLLAAKPLPGKILSEKKLADLDATEIVLSNGLKVLLKPTDFKNDNIEFTGFSSGGTSLYSNADYQSASSASNIVSASGLAGYSAIQLAKYLSDKQSSASPYISERKQGVEGSATSRDLETALQMTYLYFTQPRKDPEIFQNIMARSKASLANRNDDPNTVFGDTINAILSNHNIRYSPPTPAKIDQIKLDRAYDIYKERFADASNFTFVFVGSFKIDRIKPLLEQYLGSLPATNKKEEAKDLGILPPKGTITKTVYKGKEPKATVRLLFTGPYEFSSQNNKIMEALSETLEIRLLERLREGESGVYSPGASVTYTKYPQARCGLMVSFGCAPQNVDKLIASSLDEIRKLRTNGPEIVNLKKFKAETLRNREVALKTNDFWLSYLAHQVQTKEALNQVQDEVREIEQIKPEDVKAAAQKYLSGKNYIRLVLMPETK